MERPDPPSILSIAMRWASRVSTIGLEFAVPALIGAFLDRWWASPPWATVIGAFLGFVVGMVHILRIAREDSGGSTPSR
ncbi:AtpZ/AtpI family protein [Singulisphaera rosea]